MADFLNKNKTLLLTTGVIVLILIYGLFDPAVYRFPPCPMRTLTGWLCPGCGSQRAIHQALHGQLGQSFHLNALFIPAVIYGMLSLLTRLVFPRQWPGIRKKFFGLHAAYIALALIVIFWIGRNIV